MGSAASQRRQVTGSRGNVIPRSQRSSFGSVNRLRSLLDNHFNREFNRPSSISSSCFLLLAFSLHTCSATGANHALLEQPLELERLLDTGLQANIRLFQLGEEGRSAATEKRSPLIGVQPQYPPRLGSQGSSVSESANRHRMPVEAVSCHFGGSQGSQDS